MIGVIAEPAEHDVVREFFELFKTPWEFCRRGQSYEIVLCAGDGQVSGTANLVLVYAGRKIVLDNEENTQTGPPRTQIRILSYQGNRMPIYGESVVFPTKENCVLRDEESQECVAYIRWAGERALTRIGYDLFYEV